jgi:hypothetical protein
VAPPNFDKSWREIMETNGWLDLGEEHLESNGWLGNKGKNIFIGKSLVSVGVSNRN